MVQHIRDVFHKNGKRFKCLNITQILPIKPRSRIAPKGLRMRLDLAKFRATHSGKCLTRRTANNYIDGIRYRSKIQFNSKFLWTKRGNIARFAMPGVAFMEVQPMRSCGIRIYFDRTFDQKSRGLHTKGHPSTARKQV